MTELSAIKNALEDIATRLERLERASLPVVQHHPSLNKFNLIEDLADEIINGVKQEKACTFEPNDKPCDHCSMCGSRGF